MRVISKSRLRQFWDSPQGRQAQGPLCAWYAHVSHRAVAWNSWNDLHADFPTASLVGNCVVFNIGGNKFRLATRVLYPSQKVFVLKVMTHAEYDHDKWKAECGCYEPQPSRPSRRATRTGVH